MKLLQSKKLIHHIDHLLQQSGIVGEIKNRLILFVIALTYKLPKPLHAIVQGTSGSGKSHLINTIAECLPQDRIMSITRVSSKAFYHYKEDELFSKVLLIQDYDGLDSQALLAFREMQSAGTISSGVTEKQKNGTMHTVSKPVQTQISSLGATTNPELYYDNLSRSIIVGVDESEQQTDRIIAYNNKRKAGKIDTWTEENARRQLQILVRLIKPLPVINPYADQITLPVEAKMRRRLNSHFLALVDMVTLLHQHQRQFDEKGRVITTIHDVRLAVNLFFDAVWLKVDELDSSTRQFFEELKQFASKQPEGKFRLPQVRKHLNLSKTQVHNYIKRLRESEYVSREGSANKGHTYWISIRDNSDKLRERIKKDLGKQLRQITERQ